MNFDKLLDRKKVISPGSIIELINNVPEMFICTIITFATFGFIIVILFQVQKYQGKIILLHIFALEKTLDNQKRFATLCNTLSFANIWVALVNLLCWMQSMSHTQLFLHTQHIPHLEVGCSVVLVIYRIIFIPKSKMTISHQAIIYIHNLEMNLLTEVTWTGL